MKIVVYHKPDCVMCKYTMQELDKMELEYEHIDITQDLAARRDVDKMGFTQMPVVVVSNSVRSETWSGFKVDKLRGLRRTGDY